MWVQADGQTHGGCVAPRAKAWDEYLRCEGKRDEKEKRKEKEKEITEKKTCSLFFYQKKKIIIFNIFLFSSSFSLLPPQPHKTGEPLSTQLSLAPDAPGPCPVLLVPFFPE